MLKANDMQRAFHLAYCLHPDRHVAQRITYDACDWLSVLQGTQERRRSRRHYKLRLSEKRCLQASVFCVSERWEVDQERQTKQISGNFYQPNHDDLLVRYVKLLIWKTMDRKACHAAIGLGCHLYQYRPEQICALAPDLFDKANIRRINGYRLEEIAKRFPELDIVRRAPYGEKKVRTRSPTTDEHELVHKALALFTPWQTPHLRPTESMLALFGDTNPKLEWKRLHALIDTDCAGLARLIRAYNHSVKGQPMHLRDPDDQLAIPLFPPRIQGDPMDPSSGNDRFTPAPLSPDAITTIQHALAHNRRRRDLYQPSLLRVYVDGYEQGQFDPRVHTSAHFCLPQQASYVEIFGEDEEGALRLAVFPLFWLKSLGQERAGLQVEYQAGQRLELTLVPSSRQGDKAPALYMQVLFSAPRRAVWNWYGISLQQWTTRWRTTMGRVRPAVAGLAIAALCGLTFQILPVQQEPEVKPPTTSQHSRPLLQRRWSHLPPSAVQGWQIAWPVNGLRQELSQRWYWALTPTGQRTGTTLPHLSQTYYHTLRREIFAHLLYRQPTRRAVLHALKELWDEIDALDTPEALIAYFRTTGLESIAQHIEAMRNKHAHKRPLTLNRRLEATAIKQGLAAAMMLIAEPVPRKR